MIILYEHKPENFATMTHYQMSPTGQQPHFRDEDGLLVIEIWEVVVTEKNIATVARNHLVLQTHSF